MISSSNTNRNSIRNREPVYAELHCRTNYSFLSGASHADELVERAIDLQYTALAITDENTLAGVVRAWAAAKAKPLKLIYGAELVMRDVPPLVVWASDRQGYANLCRLLTRGRRRAPKGECWLEFNDLAEHAEGLLAGAIPLLPGERPRTQHIDATHPSFPWFAKAPSTLAPTFVPSEYLSRIRELFGDRAYLLAELFHGVDDETRLTQLEQWSRQSGLPLVAAGDVLYHSCS